MSISPNGDELLFVKAYGGRDSLHLFHASSLGSTWTKPTKAPFSIEGTNQIDPAFSPDGRSLLINMITEESNGYDVFVLEKDEDGWSAPQPVSTSINTTAHEFYATMAKSRNIYFTRRNERNDIYMSRWNGSQYEEAVPLPFNTSMSESNPYIAPNEKFLIFTSRNEETSDVDLFVSFKKGTQWSHPINLGASVNTPLNEFCPSIDVKNKRFLFSRTEVREDVRIENMFYIPLKELQLSNLRRNATFSPKD